jgi:hypothetical protein
VRLATAAVRCVSSLAAKYRAPPRSPSIRSFLSRRSSSRSRRSRKPVTPTALAIAPLRVPSVDHAKKREMRRFICSCFSADSAGLLPGVRPDRPRGRPGRPCPAKARSSAMMAAFRCASSNSLRSSATRRSNRSRRVIAMASYYGAGGDSRPPPPRAPPETVGMGRPRSGAGPSLDRGQNEHTQARTPHGPVLCAVPPQASRSTGFLPRGSHARAGRTHHLRNGPRCKTSTCSRPWKRSRMTSGDVARGWACVVPNRSNNAWLGR